METIDPTEWNFEKVDRSELIAATLWEYARESQFIRDTIKLYVEWQKAGCRNDAPGYAALNAALGKLNAPLGKIQTTNLAGNRQALYVMLAPENDPDSFPPPWTSLKPEATWQSLRPEAKAARLEVIASWPILHLVEPVRRSPISLIGNTGNGENLLIEIAWKQYTDKQIIEAMPAFLKTNRPTTMPEPSERGHKPKDWANALRDLGVMRLLNDVELGNMERRYPDAWKLYHDQAGWKDRTYWYQARRRAIEHFHSLLPLLPEGEQPIHTPTKARQKKPALSASESK